MTTAETDAANARRDVLHARLIRNPFHVWMGLSVESAGEDSITIVTGWREEFIGNPDRNIVHGGILAAMVDITADYALAARLGRPYPTIDMRVDYHRPAGPGALRAVGKVVKLGSNFSTAEASVFNAKGDLVASGRGVYFTAMPGPDLGALPASAAPT
jgi:uncharacterized protein (TIGR00369 family)